jgi:hypothetical protein
VLALSIDVETLYMLANQKAKIRRCTGRLSVILACFVKYIASLYHPAATSSTSTARVSGVCERVDGRLGTWNKEKSEKLVRTIDRDCRLWYNIGVS